MEEDTCYYDFTTATELEIFIARLEEIILEWGLHQKPLEKPLEKDDFKNRKWFSVSESLTFSEAKFQLIRYYLECDKAEEEQDEREDFEDVEVPAQAIQDMLSTENDFFFITNPPTKDSHPIARWYGLRDFLVLIPQQSSYVDSESRVKILLSSFSIAINNTKCAVPFFLAALEPWQNYFLGVFQSGSFRTEFNMVHLKRTPLHCKFLTGLLTMFKSKIGLTTVLNPVRVSVRFTYVLKDSTNYTWTQKPPDMDFLGDILGVSDLGCLPFSSAYDSINELYLSALWPSLSENSVVDSEHYSDLDPLQAPIWKVSVTTVDSPSCLLTDYYSEFVDLIRTEYSISELLGNLISNNSSAKSSSSSNALTESKLSAFVKAVIECERISKMSQQIKQPISSEHLLMFIYYLFPDAELPSKYPYRESLGGTLGNDPALEEKLEEIEKKLGGMKAAPLDGLLWRLTHVMAHVIHSLEGVRSAAYLWYRFVQQLRFRWEFSIVIPGLNPVLPEFKTCLLNQKLQLLNCCIFKKIEKNEKLEQGDDDYEDEDSDSEEEFYDCEAASEAAEEEKAGRRKIKDVERAKVISRLSRHGDLKLLETGEPLYIPVTRDLVPRTEDEVEKDEEILLEIGTDAQGSELRAKLMKSLLLADMEAFKAANPGCVFADFIRWCSPRDWIEEDGELDKFGQRKGHLSKRMEIPGNAWIEVWQMAQPVPVKWQKSFFNHTLEAEKVLDFLEKKTPKEFIEMLLPVMTVCVIEKLLKESAVDELPGVNEKLSKLIKKAKLLGVLGVKGIQYKELIKEISAVESVLVHARSLKRKFIRSSGDDEKAVKNQEETMKFIKNLLSGAETEVPGGPKSEVGSIIRNFFSEATKAEQLVLESENSQLTSEKSNVMSPFPSPHEKEMILRLSNDKGPQRLHAVLKKSECRICGAFTKNIYLP